MYCLSSVVCGEDDVTRGAITMVSAIDHNNILTTCLLIIMTPPLARELLPVPPNISTHWLAGNSSVSLPRFPRRFCLSNLLSNSFSFSNFHLITVKQIVQRFYFIKLCLFFLLGVFFFSSCFKIDPSLIEFKINGRSMFIPDSLRSCMIEADVSTYLQTPSSGQVPL